MLFSKLPEIQANDMFVHNGEYDSFDMTISKTVKAKITSTNATVGCPVNLRVNKSGEICCYEIAVDTNTVNYSRAGNYWGIVETGGVTNDTATIVIQGKATCVSGGTEGEHITEIDQNGNITSSAGGQADNILGMNLANNDIYIY